MAASRGAAAVLWLATAVLAAAVSTGAAAELDCFCDCMKNRCMTLGAGAGADKLDCARGRLHRRLHADRPAGPVQQ
ncbi:hypothetical protein ACP70R_014107 [Stipagrostis hirtigluma subsp. patula]